MKAYVKLVSSIMLAVLGSAITADVYDMVDIPCSTGPDAVVLSFRRLLVLPAVLTWSVVITFGVWCDAWKRFKQVRQ